MSGWVVMFTIDDVNDEPPTDFWLTEKFWLGDDSCVREDAKVFESRSDARRALAIYMLAQEMEFEFRIEEASDGEISEEAGGGRSCATDTSDD